MSATDSIALDACDRPDHVDVIAVRLPDGASSDPERWARTVFSTVSLPRWVSVLRALRQKFVPLIGVRPTRGDPFGIERVNAEEALISHAERHLTFWVAVGVDRRARYLTGTTVVKLHGWRGRVYWSVVRHFHGPVFTSMLRKAAKQVSAQQREA